MFHKDFLGWAMVGGYSDIDAFTGEGMRSYSTQLQDGKYSWWDNLALYVRDHDVQLPDDFISHILDYYDNGGEVVPYFDWRNDTWARI